MVADHALGAEGLDTDTGPDAPAEPDAATGVDGEEAEQDVPEVGDVHDAPQADQGTPVDAPPVSANQKRAEPDDVEAADAWTNASVLSIFE